ncbi:hypothetical protein IV203_034403 [Nitzschia inconspicua]|uniref:Uncharacterized protein n=1 Tax=Nitzschia inconspicua TaxID=303405 RepID=A0A9K3Q9Q7_9STRA|nr:hypothetical protein IV203_034403 [Nitzschia inconspicua]
MSIRKTYFRNFQYNCKSSIDTGRETEGSRMQWSEPKVKLTFLNYFLAKQVPNTCDAGEGAFAESDGEDEFGGREASNGFGIDQQRDEPAQEGIGVGNNTTDNFNDHMVLFASYMRRHYQAPYFLAAMTLPLADALPVGVAGETLTAMTGFIPNLHREEKRTRGKCKRPRKPPTCGFCRDSPDPEVKNSARDCPRRWPRGKCPKKLRDTATI